jgi:DNA-directed RNA polymerase specialized sigma24 family protein
MDQLPSRLPRPDFAALMADECRRLLGLLNDAELEQLALWKLEGLTDDEAAAQLGYSRRSIQRMLSLVRRTWQEYMPPSALADVTKEAGGD